MARRPRSDSLTTAVSIASRMGRPIEPPAHVPLAADDLPFFSSVIDEFPRSEWTCHQLELAAMLARTMADLAREQSLLRSEGSVSSSERGTPVVNPRKAVVQMHAGAILAMRRSLMLNVRATGGGKDRVASRRESARSMEEALESDADGFLN